MVHMKRRKPMTDDHRDEFEAQEKYYYEKGPHSDEDDSENWRDPWKDVEQKEYYSQLELEPDTKRKKRYGLIGEDDRRRPNTIGYAGLSMLICGILFFDLELKIVLFTLAFIFGICGLVMKVRQKALSIVLMIISAICLLFSAVVLISYISYVSGHGGIGMMYEEPGWEGEESYALEADQYAGGSDEAEGDSGVQELSEQVELTAWKCPTELIVICENNSDSVVDVDIKVVFYDEQSVMMSVEESYISYCPKGHKGVTYVMGPQNEAYEPVAYDHYEIRYSVTESYENESYEYYGDELILNSNIGINGTVLLDVQNPTGIVFDSVHYYCIFYEGGQVVGMNQDLSTQLGSSGDVLELGAPMDENYEPLSFDDYEIIVGSTVCHSF